MKVTKHKEENQQLDHGTQILRHRTECMTMGKQQQKNIIGRKFNLKSFCGHRKKLNTTDGKVSIGLGKHKNGLPGSRQAIQMTALLSP